MCFVPRAPWDAGDRISGRPPHPQGSVGRTGPHLRAVPPILPTAAHLGAEGEVVAQRGDVVLQQVDQALVEVVILALHVRVPAWKQGGGQPPLFGVLTKLRGSCAALLGSTPHTWFSMPRSGSLPDTFGFLHALLGLYALRSHSVSPHRWVLHPKPLGFAQNARVPRSCWVPCPPAAFQTPLLGSAPKAVGFYAPQLGSAHYSWTLCPVVGF